MPTAMKNFFLWEQTVKVLIFPVIYALMFIVLEGIDGTGKTTIIKKLAEELKSQGYEIFTTQEPTRTWVGNDVRRAIEEEKNGFTQALLFFADRAEHVEKLKTNSNKIILCDRFVYSTYAYQGAQLESIMGLENALLWLESVYEPMRFDPDAVFLITVDPNEGLRRIYGREKKEKFEKVEFLRRVQEIYMSIAKKHSFIVVDGNKSFEDVYNDIKEYVFKLVER